MGCGAGGWCCSEPAHQVLPELGALGGVEGMGVQDAPEFPLHLLFLVGYVSPVALRYLPGHNLN